MRRFAMIAVSMSLVLVPGLSEIPRLFAQDAPKKDTPKPDAPKADATKPETPPTATPKPDAPKADATKAEGASAADAPLPPIPPEVEAKLEAARHAVAEAIVAAQDAGLIQTTVDPPPILDILVTGRAIDERTVRSRTGVSPEVFGAWFTGYGKLEGFTAQKDVRITQPTPGLKQLFDQRANILNRHIEAVRKAKGPAPTPKAAEPKKEETKKEEMKKEAPKAAEPKKEETKTEESKAAEPKKEEPKAEEPKKGETKTEESKAAEPKKDESKPETPKTEEPKKEEPKAEETKKEEPK